MGQGSTLLGLIVVGVVIWVIRHAFNTKQKIDDLSNLVRGLEDDVRQLRQEMTSSATWKPAKPPATQEPVLPPIPVSPKAVITPVAVAGTVIPIIPPLRPNLDPAATPVAPVLRRPPHFIPPMMPEEPATPAFDWEQFMGVKGFAWIGGLALFLGIAFFIKYSFERNLISPELRVAIGFITGLGVLVGGVVMSRKNFTALSQTLCATGVVILYAVTFACRAYYHFQFFGPIATFLLMVLITTTAFFLAVRLNALVVAILGMLGGFLTPVLLSTGQDNPLGLFGYIAILDIGLMVVALHRRWNFLAALAAIGTGLMEAGWMGKFFERENYCDGNKFFVVLLVLAGFSCLWLVATWQAKHREKLNPWFSVSTLALIGLALATTIWFFNFPTLAHRPLVIFGFVFILDLFAIAISLIDKKFFIAQTFSGFATFLLLGIWTSQFLTPSLLNCGLAFYFIFAGLHSALPAYLKHTGRLDVPLMANHLFPILSLILVLVPVFKLPEVSFIVWPFILLVDVLAIALAVLTSTLLPVLAVLGLTLAATGALIFKLPADLTGMSTSFLLLAAFTVFFLVVSVWLAKRFVPKFAKAGLPPAEDLMNSVELAQMLPACSVVLPFLLIIMATLRLPLDNPSPVFGLALLLTVLLLGVTKLFSMDWMPAVGLACVAALECAWHFTRFAPINPALPLNLILAWYLIFYAVFALFPFLFLRQFSGKIIPWAAAAVAALPQFFLVHRFVALTHPNHFMGLLPAAFSIPGLLSLLVVLKKIPVENRTRLSQLAWFGGVALFFITLIFPIQFDRQWITIGWALEGVALLWLFHRVPHPGLRGTGFGLLVAGFARLALNPAVLEYQTRSAHPIFNWYLYAYGVVTICLFTGGRLLAPPRDRIGRIKVIPILNALGTILAFMLMNIEIADYFSAPDSALRFEFGGNFAREMTYTIAWALFALVMIVIGILKNIALARYAAMVLLCVTLLKLFFHDLANLNQLYRIGAFIGVAVIAMLASFAYQKYFNAIGKAKETKNETPS